MKLNRCVGKNCFAPADDVRQVQIAFSHIKTRTKFGMRPLWDPRKIDGKNSRELVDAIVCFQQLERLPVTGKIEPSGRCIAQLGRKLPANTGTMLARISSTAAQTIKHYTIASGVSLTLAVEKKAAQIAAAYHAVTGKKIQITSGTRTPAAQAKAMFANMKNGDRLTIYKNQTLAGQIRNAFDTAQTAALGNAAIILAMEQVIAAQVTRKQYISKHLIAGAVDISVTGMSQNDKTGFAKAAKAIASTVILETAIPHFHLQF